MTTRSSASSWPRWPRTVACAQSRCTLAPVSRATAARHAGNPIPACLAAVALLTGASVQRDCAQATVLGHLGQLDADDLVVIPPRAEFYCERDFHRCADSLENFADRGQITQKP